MITNNIKNIFLGLCVSCGIAVAFTACTDTWDDHYNATAQDVNSGSLWQAIKNNDDLSNFASVIEATGYDKSLGSSQVFTVFAPTNANFTKKMADDLITQYKLERQTVNDKENTVIKEFVQNHIALFNHSVSPRSNDSIVLMNGKYAVLQTGQIDRSSFTSSNKLYENGVLFTVDRPVDYSANVFEYLRKDADLDSVRSFLYNPMFYKNIFSPGSSVEGGLDSLGRTVYLDSVFYQQNELFRYIGRIADEDSTYWMVAPTNEVWRNLVDEYTQYFNYDDKVEDLLGGKGSPDSLVYTNTRLAIMEGTVFSQTFNDAVMSRKKTVTTEKDSVYSDNAVLNYNDRRDEWGAPFNYYQYFNPLEPGKGVLAEADSVKCSNGQLMKVSDWKLDKLQTFHRWIVVEAENRGSVREISKHVERGDSVSDATQSLMAVENDNFKNKVWGDRYMRFVPTGPNILPKITFSIHNVLSNIGYDIYLVMAPALANDSNATEVQNLPTTVRTTINYHLQDGSNVTSGRNNDPGVVLQTSITTSGTDMSYLKLADDFKFPVSNFNIDDTEQPQVTLVVESRVTPTQVNSRQRTKTMGIDCILLVPHGSLEVVDALPADDRVAASHQGKPGVMLYPHGKDHLNWYYMLR